MNNAERLKILSDAGRTVFSLKNLQSLWGLSPQNTKIVASRMAQKHLIIRIARGYYAITEELNIYELANLIISPSYVSLNSSLFFHGISFQVSNTITSVGLLNYQKRVSSRLFKYYSMKKSLFFNLEGIEYKKNLAIARPERAILDCLYFGILPNVDNYDKLNITYLKKVSFLYPKTVQKKIKKYIEKQ